jgi:hypothetical protein
MPSEIYVGRRLVRQSTLRMLLGHIAVGLAARRARPSASLAVWFLAVQLVDLLWPIFLLIGLERVRIAPGITAFTPLDFYHYPITHSLVGGVIWALLLAAWWYSRHRDAAVAGFLAAGVLSHWVLDVISHRPDVPLLPRGPFLGLGLWNSVAATLIVELTLFVCALVYFARGTETSRRASFWLLIGFLFVVYLSAAFGPPPANERTVAISALALWLLLPWAAWADRHA